MTKKIRILGIAPYKGLVTLMKQCALQYPEIELNAMAGNMEQGLAVARRYSEQYDIIVSRANTANMISQAVHIPVIDIGIGYYDVLRCIKMAQNTGTKFALLGFQSLTTIAKNLCDLLQIKLDIFSFSPESWKDSDRLLDNMKEQGYKTVICDMIPYDHAKLIGITPIILTSSAESVRLAIEGAIRTWHQNQRLLSSNAMLQTLIHSSSNRHLILDLNGNCLYSTLDAGKEDAFIDCLKKEISKTSSIPSAPASPRRERSPTSFSVSCHPRSRSAIPNTASPLWTKKGQKKTFLKAFTATQSSHAASSLPPKNSPPPTHRS